MEKKLKLITSDNKEIIIDREAIQCSGTIQLFIQQMKNRTTTTKEKTPQPSNNDTDDDGNNNDGQDNVNDSNIIEIQLPTIKFTVMEKVLQWIAVHKTDPLLNLSDEDHTEELGEFDEQFTNENLTTLYEYTQAAHYLDIKSLKYVMCKAISNLLRGRPAFFIDRVFPDVQQQRSGRRK